MRVLEVNVTCGKGSTGSIAVDIAKQYEASGYEVKIAYGRGRNVPKEAKKYAVRIGNSKDILVNALRARIFDNEGFNAKMQTIKFLKWADEYNPDLVWLHNIHGYYINVKLLFDWLRKREIKTYWTLHDCWAFTGHCSHFILNNCDKWKNGCESCQFHKDYPKAYFDNSKRNYEEKMKAFTGINDLTIIVPSKWLMDLVKKSFLKEYKIEVCPNKVDLTVFKPTKSDFKERYGLLGKKIILGVASSWSISKGLDDFCKLSEIIPDKYKIVLVGLKPGQAKKIPENILKIPRTDSKEKLAEIYSSADVFLNPSKQETFGMTTVEALSCGAKVIVMKGTACEEVASANGGIAIEDDVNIMLSTIERLCNESERSV